MGFTQGKREGAIRFHLHNFSQLNLGIFLSIFLGYLTVSFLSSPLSHLALSLPYFRLNYNTDEIYRWIASTPSSLIRYGLYNFVLCNMAYLLWWMRGRVAVSIWWWAEALWMWPLTCLEWFLPILLAFAGKGMPDKMFLVFSFSISFMIVFGMFFCGQWLFLKRSSV